MKTKITVAWAYTIEKEVDENRLENSYLDKIRNEAVEEAASNLNWKDGIVSDCEDFPELVE